MDKKYAVITEAFRKEITSVDEKKLIRDFYVYREGDLGLIHPAVIDFYLKLDKNMKNLTGYKDKKGRRTYQPTPPTFPEERACDAFFDGGYFHDKEDIPLLLHGVNLPEMSIISKRNEYFIVPLRNNELVEINGTSLADVKRGVKKIHKEHNVLRPTYVVINGKWRGYDYVLDKLVEEQWNHLEAFDRLMKNKIHEIPIEITRREISDGEVKDNQKFFDSIEGLRRWREMSAHAKVGI